jgi:hypothetical protein
MLDGLVANGVQISVGHFGVVGERGAELISGPATVTPISKMGRGGPITINQNFTGTVDRRTVSRADAAAGRAVRMHQARND